MQSGQKENKASSSVDTFYHFWSTMGKAIKIAHSRIIVSFFLNLEVSKEGTKKILSVLKEGISIPPSNRDIATKGAISCDFTSFS